VILLVTSRQTCPDSRHSQGYVRLGEAINVASFCTFVLPICPSIEKKTSRQPPKESAKHLAKMSDDGNQHGDEPTRNNRRLLFKVRSIADKFEGVEVGKKVFDWYQQMFEKATTFSSILASVMFSVMTLDLDTTKIPHGNANEVRIWSATGAMLFVVLVLLCTGCSLGLNFCGKFIASNYGDGGWLIPFSLALVSFLFQGLLLSGMCFFCLVLTAYAPVIGWTGFGFTVFCAFWCLVFWVVQLVGWVLKQRRSRREVEQAQGAGEE
jgi:hypothetical protein